MAMKMNEDIIAGEVSGDCLFLSKKGLSHFPESLLSQCQHVKYCYLEANSIIELPESFFRAMPCLQWLDLRKNNLEKVPTDGLADHNCLETLLLQNNRLKILPHQLGFTPHLIGLQVAGNPIENVPFEIIASGFHKLLRFLRKSSHEQKTLLPVSETIITNPSQKGGVLDRSIKHTNVQVLRCSKAAAEIRPRDVGIALNVKSYKSAAVADERTHVKLSNSRRNAVVQMCARVTSACQSFQSRYKTGSKRSDLLVTHEKIEAKAEKLRERARLKETIMRQTQILQRLKDVETVKMWRKTQKRRDDAVLLDNYQIYPSRNFADVTPFDLDRDMMKMLSRKDIYMSLKEWEHEKRQEAEKHLKSSTHKISEVEDKIGEVSEKLLQLDLDIQQDMELWKKKMSLSSRINQINKLRRTLRNLHEKNFNTR